MLLLLTWLLLILSLLGLAGFTPWAHHPNLWFTEMLTAFRLQYLLMGGLLLMLGLLAKRKLLWISAGVLCLLNLGVFLAAKGIEPALDHHPAPTDRAVRLLQMNLYVRNGDTPRTVRHILESGADIVAMEEVNPRWKVALLKNPEIKRRYPWRVAPYENQLALLSRYPVVHSEVVTDGPEDVADSYLDSYLATQIAFPTQGGQSRRAWVLVIHPQHPTTRFRRLRHEAVLGKVVQHVRQLRQDGQPLVVIGDFNATPWSASLWQMKQAAQLYDTARGRWPTPTWPAWLHPLLRIPIDQVLVSPANQWTIHSRAVGSEYGSDHLPVAVDVSLKGS